MLEIIKKKAGRAWGGRARHGEELLLASSEPGRVGRINPRMGIIEEGCLNCYVRPRGRNRNSAADPNKSHKNQENRKDSIKTRLHKFFRSVAGFVLGELDFPRVVTKLNSIVEENEVWSSLVLEIHAGDHSLVACIGRAVSIPNPHLIPHGK
jgi:hypothetical protein